ncbi:MAG: hypothetical protein NTW86_30975 [Candidatus Sumerlaeota bacterium]|nr:hypothetical protein [Candidatus Sumerlaeota bacterium]
MKRLPWIVLAAFLPWSGIRAAAASTDLDRLRQNVLDFHTGALADHSDPQVVSALKTVVTPDSGSPMIESFMMGVYQASQIITSPQ